MDEFSSLHLADCFASRWTSGGLAMACSLFFVFLFPIAVAAGSTAVSAPRFIVRTEPGEIISRDLVVSNLSSTSQQYRLFLEGSESQRLASFIPADFNLSPNQSQRVLLRFRQSERNQQRQLAVLSYDESQSGNLKIASGIKIPVYFIVPPSVIARSPAKRDDRSNLMNAPSAAIRLLPPSPRFARGRGRNDIRFIIFSIDLALFFIVCLLWQRRLFWRRRRLRHKISFV